jgi:hypothetical protein
MRPRPSKVFAAAHDRRSIVADHGFVTCVAAQLKNL